MSLAFDAKDQVRQSTDIVDLIGGYLNLSRRGPMYVALCPWHDDSHPSLQVNQSRQSWKCWVCNVGGDIFSFVMQHENVDFRGALEILAERAGIELRQTGKPTKAGDPNDKKTLFAANGWAAEQYHKCLTDSSEANSARQYLSARGISDDSISAFRIGYAPNQWSWLNERGKTQYSPRVFEACGLVGKSERGGNYYDKLRGRIIFPIFDTQQRAIAFGGRVLPEIEEEAAAKGQRLAKYWNSPETRLFSKSDNLYALNVVRDHVSKSRDVVIVEGYTDVVMAWQAGLRNVVAALGTAVNERHIKVLKRFADRITLLLDGDEAGRRRTNEVVGLFVASDADLRILTLPDQLDPFDFIQKHGVEELTKLLGAAVDALEYKIHNETLGIDLIGDTHAANSALDNILRTLALAPASFSAGSIRLREQQIIGRLARQFQIDDENIRSRLQQLRQRSKPKFGSANSSGSSNQSGQNRATVSIARCEVREVELLEILVSDSRLFQKAVEQISPALLSDGPLREIFETYIDLDRRKTSLDFEIVLTHIEDPGLKNLFVEIDDRAQKKLGESQRDLDQRLKDVFESFAKQETEIKSRQFQARLNQAKLSDDEEADLLSSHFQMKLQQHQINQENPAPKDG